MYFFDAVQSVSVSVSVLVSLSTLISCVNTQPIPPLPTSDTFHSVAIDIYIYICVRVMRVWCVCVYVCMFVFVCMCVCVCLSTYMCLSRCRQPIGHIHTRTHNTHTHTHTHTFVTSCTAESWFGSWNLKRCVWENMKPWTNYHLHMCVCTYDVNNDILKLECLNSNVCMCVCVWAYVCVDHVC